MAIILEAAYSKKLGLAPASEAQVTRLYRVIESYVHGMERQDFVPSPGLQCVTCEFARECAAWS